MPPAPPPGKAAAASCAPSLLEKFPDRFKFSEPAHHPAHVRPESVDIQMFGSLAPPTTASFVPPLLEAMAVQPFLMPVKSVHVPPNSVDVQMLPALADTADTG